MTRGDLDPKGRVKASTVPKCHAPALGATWPGIRTDGAPAVSVIVPAYDPGDYLREAINSVIAQTFTDLEIIVVDDGSHEDLAWVSSADPRASLVRQRNQGVATARNHGIAVSCGRFIAFLDQDDRWQRTKLERQVELLRAGTAFCHTAFKVIDAGGCDIDPSWYGTKVSYPGILVAPPGILLSSLIVDRAVLQHVGLFDPAFRILEDYDFFLRLARSYPASYVPTAEVDYRQHARNASKNYWQVAREMRDVYAHEDRLPSSRNDAAVALAIREGNRVMQRWCSVVAIRAARSAARRHRPLATAGHLLRAARLNPEAVRQACATLARKQLSRFRRAGEQHQSGEVADREQAALALPGASFSWRGSPAADHRRGRGMAI